MRIPVSISENVPADTDSHLHFFSEITGLPPLLQLISLQSEINF